MSSSTPPLAPPVSMSPAPSEEDVIDAPMLPIVLSQQDEQVTWDHGRKEVYKLSNGAILFARNEIEAAAYQSNGGELVDVIQDE